MIRVGTAGWHYEDWSGFVYPRPRPRGFDPLAELSHLFDTLEVNVTFYRVPDPSMTATWVSRVAGNPRFRFTVKAPGLFTHAAVRGAPGARADDPEERARHAGPGDPLDVEERRFREAVAPLIGSGLLGAVLLQFPQSFHPTAGSRAHLESLLDRFSDLPCVAEFRHAGWDERSAVALLERRGAGFCNIDQPRLSSTLRPTALVTGSVAYVRLHGRNATHWFEGTAPLEETKSEAPPGARRYDYLYTDAELAPWIDAIRRIAAQVPDGYVIANNHFRGKAAVNALEIKAALEGGKVTVPETLLDAYPRLAPIARPVPGRLPFE